MHWIKVAFWVAVIVTCIVLLVPADNVLAAKVWIASWLPMAAVLDAADVSEHADKLVHASLFTMLGVLGMRGWLRGDQRWRVLFAGRADGNPAIDCSWAKCIDGRLAGRCRGRGAWFCVWSACRQGGSRYVSRFQRRVN